MSSGYVVRAERRWSAVLCDKLFGVVGEPVGGEGAFHEPADAFAGVFIDDGADLDRWALLVGVELEIDCPDHVRLGRCRRVDGRGTDAFATLTPRDPQALLSPEPLDLLMIDDPVSPRAP